MPKHTNKKEKKTRKNPYPLPEEVSSIMDRIVVHRVGASQNAYMKTEKVPSYVLANTSYMLMADGSFTEAKRTSPRFTRKQDTAVAAIARAPHRITLPNRWKEADSQESAPSDRNILGGDGVFTVKGKKVTIPEVETTPKSLAYYGARLVKAGDRLALDTHKTMPVTHMDVGKDYARDYLLKPEHGGGAYAEHHNLPHFHMPLDRAAGGHLILGKINRETNQLELSAFKIPYGYGIYTPPGIVHCDAYLKGRYEVIYSQAEEYSTVLFKDEKGEIADVSIAPQHSMSLRSH